MLLVERSKKRTLTEGPAIWNLNFHSSVGGMQRTLAYILAILSEHWRVRVVDPYRNPEFASLLRGRGLEVETLVDLSRRRYFGVGGTLSKAFGVASCAPELLRLRGALRRAAVGGAIRVMYVNQTKALALCVMSRLESFAPVVFHCHGIEAFGSGWIPRWQGGITRVVANSEFTARELEAAGVRREKIAVVENVIDVDDLRRRAASALQGRRAFEGVGTLRVLVGHAGVEPNKGTDIAVRAAALARRKGVNLELVVAGERPAAARAFVSKVDRLVESEGLSQHVRFIGRQSDLARWIAAVDVVIVPSRVRESFGRVAAEALALGKPVIAANRGNLPFLVRHGQWGLIYEAESPEQLARWIGLLARDEPLRRRMGIAGERFAMERFNVERFRKRLLDVFVEVYCKRTGKG